MVQKAHSLSIRNRSFFIVLTIIARISFIVWNFIIAQILIDIYFTCIDGIFFFISIVFPLIICSEIVIIMIITFFFYFNFIVFFIYSFLFITFLLFVYYFYL